MKNLIERIEKENNINRDEFTLVGVSRLLTSDKEGEYHTSISNDRLQYDEETLYIKHYKTEVSYDGNGKLILVYNDNFIVCLVYMKSNSIHSDSEEDILNMISEDSDKLSTFLIEYDSISSVITVNHIFNLMEVYNTTKALSDRKYFKTGSYYKYDSGYIVSFDTTSLLNNRIFIFFKED